MFEVCDQYGSMIQAVMFREAIEVFHKDIKVGDVYLWSGGRVIMMPKISGCTLKSSYQL